MTRFQLVSDNSGIFKAPTIVLKTTEIPRLNGEPSTYESCIFVQGDSDVVAQYDNISAAILGHTLLTSSYGLKV